MSLVSTRSMVLAVGVAVCGLAVAARPVRSWAAHRGLGSSAQAKTGQAERQGPVEGRGLYPDVDIQLIDDYGATKRTPNPPLVRIEMDIPAPLGTDLGPIRDLLKNGGSATQIYKAIKAATNLKDSDPNAPGYKVLHAALKL